ncbi:MAG: isochorismatase family protein [Pseudomonadota bacterium]
MANFNREPRALIEGRAALIVVDIQASTFINHDTVRAIDNMPDYRKRMEAARAVADQAHASGIPVIFIQEIHRADGVDFGRELDGDEDVCCLDAVVTS